MSAFWIYLQVGTIFLLQTTESADYIDSQRYRESYNSPRWRYGYYPRQNQYYQLRRVESYPPPSTRNDDYESNRYLKSQTFQTISETLGALNTVGRYLVNMTRSGKRDSPGIPEDVPGAIYTISKNVLGRNVTDTIAPLVREAIPVISPGITTERADLQSYSSNVVTEKVYDTGDSRSCITPDGSQGFCDDLRDCPQLLLNLGILRQSLCFKSLFVPGVCCPKNSNPNPTRPFFTTTTKPLVLKPVHTQIYTPTTTYPSVLTTRPSTVAVTESPVRSTTDNSFTLPPLIVDPLDCGQPENAKFRVVGGEEAVAGSWPWMAAIFLHGPRRTEFWCGGSLISSRHILTAAHCTKDTKQKPFAARQFTVRLGDVDLKRDDEPSAPETYGVEEIIAHSEFSRVGFYNDIAILVLDKPVKKSKYVIPLCLPENDLQDEQFAGQTGTVVGWGTTYYGGKESSMQRQAVLPIWRNEDCNDAYFQPITSNFLCAGYSRGGTDACQGDSGGPLMLPWNSRWIQVGVVSFGNKCGEPGYPGVYTRITEYVKWIKNHLKT